MVNHTGANQFGLKDYPPNDKLLEAFTAYSKENSGVGLSAKDQLTRLAKDFDLKIGRKKLFELRKKVGAPSVRKDKNKLSELDKVQAVVDLKVDDVQGRWGVTAVKQRLANSDILMTRKDIRTILHDEFDHEFEARFVGKQRERSRRTPLFALGPWHQEHSDGHEKLSQQGLNIGKDIALPIYANKDQFSSWVHELIVMPNVRSANSMAHYYLDLIEMRDFRISIQLTTDQGTEVNLMHQIHEALRLDAAPEFTVEEWPPTKKLPSTNNTPIESFWRWQRNGEGHTIKMIIQSGANRGIFCPQLPVHKNTFYWIFVPLVQHRLDVFRDYWNHHKLTGNSKKKNPYGSSPKNMLISPESVRETARDCSIRVNPETLYRLREAHGGQEARDAAYRFVSQEFQADADGVYVDLGAPKITLESAWDVFEQMVNMLGNLPHWQSS